uniref:Bestrophin homolog n=1 Tax=Syphacia muris TaxID=451379 RepID=A0A0N5AD91_9BILA
MEENDFEKQSLNSQVSEWDSVSLGQPPYLDIRLPQLEIDRSSPIPPRSRNGKSRGSHLYSDIQQQFLCVPSHSALYSGRTSPSVTGSIQSDPESCMDVSKYQQDDSDDEGMGVT